MRNKITESDEAIQLINQKAHCRVGRHGYTACLQKALCLEGGSCIVPLRNSSCMMAVDGGQCKPLRLEDLSYPIALRERRLTPLSWTFPRRRLLVWMGSLFNCCRLWLLCAEHYNLTCCSHFWPLVESSKHYHYLKLSFPHDALHHWQACCRTSRRKDASGCSKASLSATN